MRCGRGDGLPPGLAKKDELPPGLAKQETLPPGLGGPSRGKGPSTGSGQGQGKGLETAPGQNKEPGEAAVGKGQTESQSPQSSKSPQSAQSKRLLIDVRTAADKLVQAVGTGGGQSFTGEQPGEFLYYFHPDHLGSTSYVTDDKGALYEHLQYFPFGETWVQQGQPSQRIPYLFTSKELDEETGLYYFGARYYDPRTSVWVSADPALGKYLMTDGIKKLARHSGPLGLYGYVANNPLRLFDPDGAILKQVDLGEAFTGTTSYPMWDATVADKIKTAVGTIRGKGIDFKIISGTRSSVEQGRLRAARLAREAKADAAVAAVDTTPATGPDVGVDKKALWDKIAGLPAAKAGSGAHEGGFAFDTNWNDLKPAEQAVVKDVLGQAGFTQFNNGADRPHFRADPQAHGYKGGLPEAIRENQIDLKEKTTIQESWMDSGG